MEQALDSVAPQPPPAPVEPPPEVPWLTPVTTFSLPANDEGQRRCKRPRKSSPATTPHLLRIVQALTHPRVISLASQLLRQQPESDDDGSDH